MIDVEIPGFGRLELTDVICDFNGTLAVDGKLHDAARTRLTRLSDILRVHVVTGDTYGSARGQLRQLPCNIVVLPATGQAEAKARFIEDLGAGHASAVGNGRNDRLMLEAAALSIGVCGDEGIATEALHASDVVVGSIADALDLLLQTKRLIATLRS
jgi:soluble P-type ATPase